MPTADPLLAKSIRPTEDGLIVQLEEQEIRIAWRDCSEMLASAGVRERTTAELSPGGYGIHWPLIDEDLSIGGLVARARRLQRN